MLQLSAMTMFSRAFYIITYDIITYHSVWRHFPFLSEFISRFEVFWEFLHWFPKKTATRWHDKLLSCDPGTIDVTMTFVNLFGFPEFSSRSMLQSPCVKGQQERFIFVKQEIRLLIGVMHSIAANMLEVRGTIQWSGGPSIYTSSWCPVP